METKELKIALQFRLNDLKARGSEGDLIDQSLNLGRRQMIVEILEFIDGKDKDTEQAEG